MPIQPTAPIEIPLEFKRSKFLTFAYPVSDRQQFDDARDNLKRLFPDASHHCWAFKLAKGGLCGQSDDGEPKGTAGMPMLNVLNHSDAVNLGVVVVRYFGGTKLGTGGLARAYSECVKQALDLFTYEPLVDYIDITLQLDYQYENAVRHALQQADISCTEVVYGEQVSLTIAATDQQWQHVKPMLVDLTRGELRSSDVQER